MKPLDFASYIVDPNLAEDAPKATARPELSRRGLLRAGGLLATGAAFTALPFGRQLLAHDVSESWPNVAAMGKRYVDSGKVANLFCTFGWGEEDHAHTVGGGKIAIGSATEVDENTLYRIYSQTKPVTGMAIMLLIDEGKLTLDQPLHDILPAFKDMQVLVDPAGSLDNTVPAKTPITIRHLLTHTAGLGYDITSRGELQKAFFAKGVISGRVSKLPIPGLPNVTPPPSLEAWADRLAELPLMYQPGTKWSYSASIDLLGRVIEVVSGLDFPTFLQTRFFDPLGMNSTYFKVPQSELGRLTTNYGVQGGFVVPIDVAWNSVFTDMPTAPMGGADLVSSPKDYDRFLRMVLNLGKFDDMRIMSEEAVRLGTSNLLADNIDLSGTWVEGQGHGAGGRSVNGTYGWGGAAGTLGAVDFNNKLRACLWTQYIPAESYPIRKEYLAAVAKDLGARSQ